MAFIVVRSATIALLALLSAAMIAPPFSAAGAPPSLKGQFLIATDTMRDPRFDRAVILMVSHDSDGALGIVINRPLGEKPLADLLAAFGDKDTAATGGARIFLGGPVQPEISFVIHSTDYQRPETLEIDARLAATPSLEVLRDIARNSGPMKSLIAFGYAGWTAGQLEGELARNVWYVAPADPGLVFDDDRNKVWEHATARRIQDL